MKRRRPRSAGNASDSPSDPVRLTRHPREDEFLKSRLFDLLDMLIDDPDDFDPDCLARDEDGMWDLDFEVQADLRRNAHCKIGHRIIVHDEVRVLDAKGLGLQAVVFPAFFAYAAQIVMNAAEILIACYRTEGAKALVDAFIAAGHAFELDAAASTPVRPRFALFRKVERSFEHAVRTLVVGHEIGHYLVHAEQEKGVPTKDNASKELQCDSLGLQTALLFDEKYAALNAVESEEGPEVELDEGIGDAWRVFEHLATALFFGDALVRRTENFLDGEKEDAFALASRRLDLLIGQFRSSKAGRLYPPYPDLSVLPLQQAFWAVDAFLERTLDRSDERFARRLPVEDASMAGDSLILREYFSDKLRSIGMVTSLGGIIIPSSTDHPGIDRWLRIFDQTTTPRSETRPRSRPMLSF